MKNSNDKDNNVDTIKSRRKKNPKDMSIEELEDYIQKNRNRNSSNTNQYAITESKYLNNSFQSHNRLSFFENTNTSNNVNTVNKTIFSSKNHNINQNISNSMSGISITNPNDTNTNTTSNNNGNSDNSNQINQNPISSLNSKAASNYLKSLQEKIKTLSNENDELKKKI